MANDQETPKTPRRTTRSLSSSLKTPPKPSISPQNPSFSFSEVECLSVDDLLSSLPGRRPQILEILRLIGPLNSPMPPLLLYGSPVTGKTATILQIFRHLNRPFVYTSARSCFSPRILFESVINQLVLHRKSSIDGYSSAKRCEKASEFVGLLRDSLVQALNGLKNGDGKMIYLIFDNVELIRSWDKNSSAIVSLLFKICDLLKIPELGLIYISSSTPVAYYSSRGSIEPLTVHFPDYTADDLHSIFMKDKGNPKLYSSFLSVVLKPFFRITKRVDELVIAFKPLFQKYCEPLVDPRLVPDEATKRRLFDYLQPHIAASLNETFKVPSWSSLEASSEGTSTSTPSKRKLAGKGTSNGLEFHMSVSAKYLLLSAFLASRNPATLDAAVFDPTGESNNRKRRRKSSQSSMVQKEIMAEEVLMKGPGSFPLERLLAIFQCITSVAEGTLEEEQLEEGLVNRCGNFGLMSDVLLQLSTLCNANFICKSGSCPLEGSSRYRSIVDEEMALKVAKSIDFPLSKYLRR